MLRDDEIDYDYYNKYEEEFKEYIESQENVYISENKNNKKKRKIFTIIVIVIALIISVISIAFNMSNYHEVHTEILSMGTITESVAISGTVKSANEKSYYSFTSAQVTSLNVKVGDKVSAGDILATFDSIEIDSYVMQLKYQVDAAEANYENKVGKYNAINTSINSLNNQISTLSKQWGITSTSSLNSLTPSTVMYKPGKLEPLEVIDIESDLDVLGFDNKDIKQFENIYENSQNEIVKAIADNDDNLEKSITNAIADAEKKLEVAFADSSEINRRKIHLLLLEQQLALLKTQLPTTAEISELTSAKSVASQLYEKINTQANELKNGWRAKFDGVVTQLSIKEGSTVTPEEPGIVISDINKKIVDVKLSTVNAENVLIDQTAIIYIGDKIVNGQVSFISPVAVEENGTTYIPCQIELNEDNEDLVVGFDVKVEIQVNSAAKTVLVPISCVKADKHGKYCFVYKEKSNTVEKRYFVEGIVDDQFYQVLYGLERKEKVVVNPSDELEDGDKARLMKCEISSTQPIVDVPLYGYNSEDDHTNADTQIESGHTNDEYNINQNDAIQNDSQTGEILIRGTNTINI